MLGNFHFIPPLKKNTRTDTFLQFNEVSRIKIRQGIYTMINDFLPATQDDNFPATQSERFNRLKQQAMQAPELWQPNEGDTLIGEIVGSRKVVTLSNRTPKLVKHPESPQIAIKQPKHTLKEQGANNGI